MVNIVPWQPDYISLHSEQRHDPSIQGARRRPWQPGFIRRLPWAGVISILLALGCTAAAVSIALESDNAPLDRWVMGGYDVQPAVLLSIVATIGNALFVFAFTQGATIHWWNQALDPRGTTLSRLHSSYHYGSGLVAIFSSVAALNTVAAAGLFMPILLMDTPLFQRSVGILQTADFSRTNATIPISPSPFMQGSTGVLPDHDPMPALYHPLFAKVLQQYTNRDPIMFPNGTCIGTCHLEVVAPGWDIDCVESTAPYRLATFFEAQQWYANSYSNGSTMKNSTYDGPKVIQTVFDIDVLYNYTESPLKSVYEASGVWYGMDFNVTRKSTPGGNGTLSYHNCRLMEALVKYPLTLQNSTVSLAPMPPSVNRTVELVYRMLEFEGQGNYPSTIGGLYLALYSAFQTNSKITPVGGWYSLRDANPISSKYLRADNASQLDSTEVFFEDPMADMILMANELAFRTAYSTSSNVPGSVWLGATKNFYNLTSAQPYVISPNLTSVARPLHQRAVLSSSTPKTVYTTHRGWLAGGAAVMCIAAVLISCTYWGFWRLGRPVSMSPLEIARAFDAPVLRSSDPNATGDDLKKEFGEERIYPGRFTEDVQLKPVSREFLTAQPYQHP